MSAKPQNTADATDRLLRCMEAIGQWMASNRQKLNPMKTDLLWCATRRRQHQLNRSSLVFGSATVQPLSTVRDFGVILDSEMSFRPYINQLISRCFYQLRCVKSCVKVLPTDVARTVINSFVISLIDYCDPCRQPSYTKQRQVLAEEEGTAISTESAASSDEQRWTTHLWTEQLSSIASVVCCVIDFTGCRFHNGYSTSFVC